MFTTQNDAFHLAEEFLSMASAEPAEIARLFGEIGRGKSRATPALCPGSGKSPAGPLSSIGLQVCAEREKTTLTILHYKLARFPRHVGEMPSELHASGCVLRIKRVRIFDE
jgi:hypothetical protein